MFGQTKMDTPEEDLAEDMQDMHVMQDLETSSPGLGPGPRTRRRRGPGNLWTLEAREDMFRRREAGEGWETIILVRGRSTLSVHGPCYLVVRGKPSMNFLIPSDRITQIDLVMQCSNSTR